MDLEKLKAEVAKKLFTEYNILTIEEAEESVTESVENYPSIWNENSDASDLAKLLASDDEDE